MSMIDFPKIDSQGFFHDWNGFAMDRFNDPHLPSAGFTRRGVNSVRALCVSAPVVSNVLSIQRENGQIQWFKLRTIALNLGLHCFHEGQVTD